MIGDGHTGKCFHCDEHCDRHEMTAPYCMECWVYAPLPDHAQTYTQMREDTDTDTDTGATS